MIPKREEDGLTHINVYSRGATELGRLLSNFAHIPITVPNDGTFHSIEGYWYWLSAHDDRLRTVWGVEAKRLGRMLRGANVTRYDHIFQRKIIIALEAKLHAFPRITYLMRKTTAPFVHYYVTNDSRVIDHTTKSQWMLNIFENWRRAHAG